MLFERALVLFQQSRFDLAEQELRQQLTANPQDASAHALLALTLQEQQRPREALQEARQGIHLEPEEPFTHYALARVLEDQDQLREAEMATQEAIRLNTGKAVYWALLATIYVRLQRWQAALDAAETGLRLDPIHMGCANMRATALIKLGRRSESVNMVQAALQHDPENTLTHANLGWIALETNDHHSALQHFREALRLDPNFEWARAGIIEAFKARHVFYRLLLRYFFWMSRLNRRTRWVMLIGLYFVARLARTLGRAMPEFLPVVIPIAILYIIFIYLTWTAKPLSNLLLRLDRFGRLALSRDEIAASNWVGGFMLTTVLSLGLYGLTGHLSALLLAIGAALMVIPASGTFRAAAGRSRTILGVYSSFLGLVGLLSVGLAFVDPDMPVIPASIFLLGLALFTWLANFIIHRR